MAIRKRDHGIFIRLSRDEMVILRMAKRSSSKNNTEIFLKGIKSTLEESNKVTDEMDLYNDMCGYPYDEDEENEDFY